ncbi:MAG: cyclic nucleotide-binding and patatin-like phospholipase domain-containing protein [Gemmatimonadetes bacterium]|nr:cyclic nucleotide-binding and patatin-like phospholipase domain-containing protein [Gemmatimonadota bacterium]
MVIDRKPGASPHPPDPVQVIADSSLLRSANRSSLNELRPLLEWVELAEGQALSLTGAHGDALYFVAEGQLEIPQATADGDGQTRDSAPPVVARVTTGDVVGELQAPTDDTRPTTARAITPTRLVRLPRQGLDHYLANHPGVAGQLTDILTPRLYRRQMLTVLRGMFGEVTPDLLADIEQRVTWHHIPREGILFWQGESSDRVFVVISGRLQVLSTSDAGAQKVVEEIVQGGAVGEAGVFAEGTQSMSVFAIRDSVVLEFPYDDFRKLAGRYPKLSEWLARRLSTRLRGIVRGTSVQHQCTNIVLVAASADAPMEDFAHRFCESLSREATCLLVSSAKTDDLLGVPGVSQAMGGSPDDLGVRAWLDQHETRYRYVIYLADRDVTNWTRRCIRQADEVIALGIAEASPEMTAVEAAVLREEQVRRVETRKSLLLLHKPDRTMPSDTARWLEPRTVNRHLHLHDLGGEEIDRIVRYVLQRELGLVLSGGGARGLAHIGVLRAVREAGLSVDFIIGVSMGALVGGRESLSGDVEQIVPRLKKQMTRAFSDYTLPILSLARGRRFDRCLEDLFGETRIEDLWTPYLCVSSNLTKADTVVHRTGPVWWAIRASSGLPGLVPPVVDDGDLLYDGALMNNLPIDIMREEIRSGPVIAVDVVPPVDLELHAPQLFSPSGWRLALNRLNPLATPMSIPGIVAILQRAGQLPSLHTRRLRLAAELADLYVRPPVEQFKILDFSTAEAAVEIGYNHGATAIGEWLTAGGGIPGRAGSGAVPA